MPASKTALALATAGFLAAAPAFARNDPGPATYEAALKDKTVVLVPMSTGEDLAQGWAHYVGDAVKAAGGKFEVRDPNWNTEAGAQAITEAINSKPAVIIVQAPDLQSYSKLFRRAQEAGIYVIQVDNPTNYPTEAFVGSNWTKLGELEAQAVINGCGPNSSKEIGLIQGDQTNSSSLDQYTGIQNVLKDHPDFKIVAQPDSNWDASTARSVATTLIQQHPNVCGIIDYWDATAQGTAAAIRAAGKTGKITLATTGGGEQADCNLLDTGVIDALVATDVPNQSRDVITTIKFLMQSGIKPGTVKTWLYTPEHITTKADIKNGTCWNLKDFAKSK
jgi:ribose transport system substrate-binding protein